MNFRFFSKPPTGSTGLLAQAALLVPLLTTAAIAQTAATTSPPTPASAVTNPAPAAYRSALEGYQSYTDEQVINWKEANDNTASIGGWRAYAKEASQSAQTPQMPDAAAKADPHAGHAKP